MSTLEAAEEDPRFLRAAPPLSAYLDVVSVLRLAASSRAWRAALGARSVARAVELTARAGVTCDRVTDETLRAAVSLAGGGATSLDVRGCRHLSSAALGAALEANAATLREVRLGQSLEKVACTQAVALLSASPCLRLFHATALKGSVEEAAQLLTALAARGTQLDARCSVVYSAPTTSDAINGMLSFMAGLPGLQLGQMPPPTPPPFAGRVLASGDGVVFEFKAQLNGETSAAALVSALHASLLPRLRRVELRLPGSAFDWSEEGEDGRHYPLAEALGALITADAPALARLQLSADRALKAEDLAPLAEALKVNAHLRELDLCGTACADADGDDPLADFARHALLPAVAANTGLRALRLCAERQLPELRQAEAIVQQRAD